MFRIKTVLVAVVLLVITCGYSKEMTEIEALASSPSRCTYEHAYDMYGANCAGLRLSKIPSLRGGLEILDFSDNKLHELSADTLSAYSSIKFLYLAENQIYIIDENAFTSLTNLETLDLSSNVVLQLPNSLFQLPSLRKLYLRGNPFLHQSSTGLTISKPIRAPLELLDISDCKIKKLPNWGNLPQLALYNISHNPLVSLETAHFTTLCNLKKIDLTESINDIQLCNLKNAISWFALKSISFQLEDYSRLNSGEFDICPVVNDTAIYNATYHRCKSEYQQVQNIKASRRTWLSIGGGLAGFLVGFILILYVMHRHNVAQTKTTAEKSKQNTPAHDPEKHAHVVLINTSA